MESKYSILGAHLCTRDSRLYLFLRKIIYGCPPSLHPSTAACPCFSTTIATRQKMRGIEGTWSKNWQWSRGVDAVCLLVVGEGPRRRLTSGTAGLQLDISNDPSGPHGLSCWFGRYANDPSSSSVLFFQSSLLSYSFLQIYLLFSQSQLQTILTPHVLSEWMVEVCQGD